MWRGQNKVGDDVAQKGLGVLLWGSVIVALDQICRQIDVFRILADVERLGDLQCDRNGMVIVFITTLTGHGTYRHRCITVAYIDIKCVIAHCQGLSWFSYDNVCHEYI